MSQKLEKKQDKQNRLKEKEAKKQCKKCREHLSLAQRACADYENLKKETEKWKQDFVKFANEGLLLELIPVMDHFSEAMRHIPKEEKKADWVIGIKQIKKQLKRILENNGIEIYGRQGDEFNPNLYEALQEMDDRKFESGKIVKVVKSGYKIGERVVRAGQVVVAR